jgi:uncharacterized protein (TIGR03084 family)
VDLQGLLKDLVAEHESLESIVVGLEDDRWDVSTPAEPWTVRDQISHLAYFDERARDAVADRATFEAHLQQVGADPGTLETIPLEPGRTMSPEELLAWWRRARLTMVATFAELDPTERVSWYGPPMSPASFVSARLMETWAHGQDVVDGLGVRRASTDRLRHIAHLGVRARPFAYNVRGMTLPPVDVQVVLTSPGGETWSWGSDDAPGRVEGSALGFCLVVTQRRHPDDTDLKAVGDAAVEWMSIAQCFAGPPGAGRKAGSFHWRND